jgi:hypothetical protein
MKMPFLSSLSLSWLCNHKKGGKKKKKGCMKNKQREIPSPSYAEPKHIFLIAHKR